MTASTHATLSRIYVGLIVLSLFTLTFTASMVRPVAAQTPDPSDQVQRIAKQLNCPTCAGRNLADCPTDTCMQWKKEIQTQLQQGKSAQDVINYFQARFGPAVLQEPPKEGALLVVWVLPIVGLIALAFGAVVLLRRIGRPQVVTASSAQAGKEAVVDDSYTARLEEEVRQTGR
jgi:cytochrome c-type biogenesis protein CcmH